MRDTEGGQGRTSKQKTNVLITLHRGYGLGDAVQMSAVLRHVAKYRPEWNADFVAEAGRHCVGRGHVQNTFEYGKSPFPDKVYDAVVEICLYDTWANWGDRPNTRVSSCLHERFGLPWDAACGRYQINWGRDVGYEMQAAMSSFIARREKLTTRAVAIHYHGDSSQAKKNLTDTQASQICDHILALGRVPLLLDWRDISPVANRADVCTTGRKSFSQEWGRDAACNAALIHQCEAFVGIDSGPSKCASSTNTPALVTWTGHHPAPFHDPAPNTTHLVPRGYHGLEPVCDDRGVIEWVEKHYNVRQYERAPVDEIKAWLTETLK